MAWVVSGLYACGRACAQQGLVASTFYDVVMDDKRDPSFRLSPAPCNQVEAPCEPRVFVVPVCDDQILLTIAAQACSSCLLFVKTMPCLRLQAYIRWAVVGTAVLCCQAPSAAGARRTASRRAHTHERPIMVQGVLSAACATSVGIQCAQTEQNNPTEFRLAANRDMY